MSSIRVYEYGLRAPTLGADLVAEQMLLGHRYRNKLVEIERRRRDKVRAIMAAHPDAAPIEAELAPLLEQQTLARDAIKATRKAARRRAETPEARAAARDLGTRIKDLRAQLSSIRKEITAACKPQLDEATEQSRVEIKQARKDCGVYWGTYLLHEASADQARQSVTPPAFARWREEGRIGVQLQNGLPLDDLWGTDTQLQVGRVDPRTFAPETRRGDRRRMHRTTLRMRIGSDGRKPIWAEFPMFYHRPLPEGAVIKYAVVSRRRRNVQQWRWLVHLTVDLSACQVTRPAPATGVVALNLGFRRRDNGALRSGYLVGSDGLELEVLAAKSDLARGTAMSAEQELRARAWITNGLGKASSIRSIRDRNLAEMQSELIAWSKTRLAAQTADGGASDEHGIAVTADRSATGTAGRSPDDVGLPEWFADRLKFMHAWKSQERFRALHRAWSADRFSGDGEGFELLHQWKERDDHLEPYESGLRRSAIYDRREAFRVVAARMAQRYATLIIDDTDIQEVIKSPAIEAEAQSMHTPARNLQRMAAPGELRLVMINAFGSDRVIKLSAREMTRTCHRCGRINENWKRSDDVDLIHTCDHCGASWDQDANNGHNMLVAHFREAANPAATETSKKPSRSERLRAAKSQPRTDAVG